MSLSDFTESFRGFFSLLLGGALAFGFYRRKDIDLSPDKRWAPLVSPWLLPLFLITFLVLLPITGSGRALPMFGAMCLGIFLHMSVYYILLIALVPLLRRWISARACAVLWLLPNFLYLCQQSFMRRSSPLLIFHLRGSWLRWAVIIWLAGAVGVFFWRCIEHLCFRRSLLQSAKPEPDESIKASWENMLQSVKIKESKVRLLRSPSVTTPLSVGLFPSTTFVVLPETAYSAEGLELILRHELIHIARRDSQTKLFLTLCTAVCWFNPLMWLAIRRCAEDLELSCDELVLEFRDEPEKRRYADLILHSAGESRGFTSSLAPAAASLRYRLKQIMSPGKRLTGGIAAGAALFLLLISSGAAAFAFGSGTVESEVFGGQVPDIEISNTVDMGIRNEYGSVQLQAFRCTDPAALMDYLSGLTVCRLSGNYDLESNGEFLAFFLPGEEGARFLDLEEHCLTLAELHGRTHAEQWYLESAPDWDYIRSLLEEEEAEAIPVPPDMEIVFGPETAIDGEVFTARGTIVENTLDGEPSDIFSQWESSGCLVENVTVEWADIRFPFDIPPKSVTVTAAGLNGEPPQSTDPDEAGRITLLPYSARYTVDAEWEFGTDAGMQFYAMEYTFDVILPEE